MVILYYPLRLLLFLIGALPVSCAARLGRFFGAIAWCIDKRHRQVTIDNLRLVFGKELSEAQIRALAFENYKRVVEAYFSAICTLQMSEEALQKYMTLTGVENIPPQNDPNYGVSRVGLIGHFGNFELYAKNSAKLQGLQFATTYRGLDNKLGDRLLETLRSKSNCLFFERRREGAALKKAMVSQPLLVGLLADQHPGDRGIWLPFMGIECLCSTSPAVFALRYNCPIIPAFCYRRAPGRWKIVIDKTIHSKVNGKPRSIREIMVEVNAAYERAIRQDPANWFWPHRRWKSYYKRLENQKKENAHEPPQP
jgi:lauroyl/myristoyl acyltransferase